MPQDLSAMGNGCSTCALNPDKTDLLAEWVGVGNKERKKICVDG